MDRAFVTGLGGCFPWNSLEPFLISVIFMNGPPTGAVFRYRRMWHRTGLHFRYDDPLRPRLQFRLATSDVDDFGLVEDRKTGAAAIAMVRTCHGLGGKYSPRLAEQAGDTRFT
jgi:hypothetical protein